ncbi:MAG: hypothetical protein ACLQGV_06015 [Bryobacteraceae bacterium]
MARTPGQRRDYARQRRRDETDLPAARNFGTVAAILAEEALETLPWNHPGRRPLTGLLAALRTEAGVLAEYRQWRETQPEFAQVLTAAGAKHQARLETMLAGYLVMPEARNAA